MIPGDAAARTVGGSKYPLGLGLDHVPELLSLRLEVRGRQVTGVGIAGHALLNPDPLALEGPDLRGIVGQHAHPRQTEMPQDRDLEAVLALIGVEPEAVVRLHRIGTLVLELIRLQLVQEPNAATLLGIVDKEASLGLGDP